MRGTLAAALAALGLIAAATTSPAPLRAQSVVGLGEDALGVPRGNVRLTIGAGWERFDEVFDAGGDAISLGAPFTRDSLGADAFETLRPLEGQLRSLSAIAGLRVTLGSSVTTVSARVRTVPVILEAGLSSRLTIAVAVPFVEARVIPHPSVNPSATGGNISVNPALTDDALQSANTQFFQELDAAQAQLAALLTACQGGSSDPRCPAVLAQGPALQAAAVPFGDQLETVFSGAFVPLLGTPADVALRQRLSGFTSAYNALLASQVITLPGPHAATAVFSTGDLQNLLTSAAFGFEPLVQRRRNTLGDVELRAQLQLVNTLPREARFSPAAFGFRFAVGGLVRLGTGTPEIPTSLIDLGSGDGQTDVEARAVSDLVFGRRFWMSVAARYGWQLADERLLRVASRDDPFAPAYTEQQVSRDLGDYLEVEVTPRFVLSRYFMLAGQYTHRRKAVDRHTGTFTLNDLSGQPVTLDASILDAGTLFRQQRVTAAIVYSTVAAYRERRARWPLELAYRHIQTVIGSGGFVPKSVTDAVELRLYVRLFGPDDRRSAAAPR